MKIKVNTEVISAFNPCKDRYDNWKLHYLNFNKDITQFLRLPNITYRDKLWVALRLIPLEMRVVFALDMSFSAYSHYAAADAAYAAAAADAAYAAAAYAADAAAYAAADAAYAAADAAADAAAAARKKEEESQIEVLIYLIEGE